MALLQHFHAGQGRPPLLFIHAFGCDHTNWAAQIVTFSRQYAVVAVDLGGHGDTLAHPDHARVEPHADGVINLTKALGLGPAIIISKAWAARLPWGSPRARRSEHRQLRSWTAAD